MRFTIAAILALGGGHQTSSFSVTNLTTRTRSSHRHNKSYANRARDTDGTILPTSHGALDMVDPKYDVDLPTDLTDRELRKRRKELERKIKRSSKTAEGKDARSKKMGKGQFSDIELANDVGKVAELIGGGLLTTAAGRTALQKRNRKLEDDRQRNEAEQILAKLDEAKKTNRGSGDVIFAAGAVGFAGFLFANVAGLVKNDSTKSTSPSTTEGFEEGKFKAVKAGDNMKSSGATRPSALVPSPGALVGGEAAKDATAGSFPNNLIPSPTVPDMTKSGSIETTTAKSKPAEVNAKVAPVPDSGAGGELDKDSVGGPFVKSLVSPQPETDSDAKNIEANVATPVEPVKPAPIVAKTTDGSAVANVEQKAETARELQQRREEIDRQTKKSSKTAEEKQRRMEQLEQEEKKLEEKLQRELMQRREKIESVTEQSSKTDEEKQRRLEQLGQGESLADKDGKANEKSLNLKKEAVAVLSEKVELDERVKPATDIGKVVYVDKTLSTPKVEVLPEKESIGKKGEIMGSSVSVFAKTKDEIKMDDIPLRKVEAEPKTVMLPEDAKPFLKITEKKAEDATNAGNIPKEKKSTFEKPVAKRQSDDVGTGFSFFGKRKDLIEANNAGKESKEQKSPKSLTVKKETDVNPFSALSGISDGLKVAAIAIPGAIVATIIGSTLTGGKSDSKPTDADGFTSSEPVSSKPPAYPTAVAPTATPKAEVENTTSANESTSNFGSTRVNVPPFAVASKGKQSTLNTSNSRDLSTKLDAPRSEAPSSMSSQEGGGTATGTGSSYLDTMTGPDSPTSSSSPLSGSSGPKSFADRLSIASTVLTSAKSSSLPSEGGIDAGAGATYFDAMLGTKSKSPSSESSPGSSGPVSFADGLSGAMSPLTSAKASSPSMRRGISAGTGISYLDAMSEPKSPLSESRPASLADNFSVASTTQTPAKLSSPPVGGGIGLGVGSSYLNAMEGKKSTSKSSSDQLLGTSSSSTPAKAFSPLVGGGIVAGARALYLDSSAEERLTSDSSKSPSDSPKLTSFADRLSGTSTNQTPAKLFSPPIGEGRGARIGASYLDTMTQGKTTPASSESPPGSSGPQSFPERLSGASSSPITPKASIPSVGGGIGAGAKVSYPDAMAGQNFPNSSLGSPSGSYPASFADRLSGASTTPTPAKASSPPVGKGAGVGTGASYLETTTASKITPTPSGPVSFADRLSRASTALSPSSTSNQSTGGSTKSETGSSYLDSMSRPEPTSGPSFVGRVSSASAAPSPESVSSPQMGGGVGAETRTSYLDAMTGLMSSPSLQNPPSTISSPVPFAERFSSTTSPVNVSKMSRAGAGSPSPEAMSGSQELPSPTAPSLREFVNKSNTFPPLRTSASRIVSDSTPSFLGSLAGAPTLVNIPRGTDESVNQPTRSNDSNPPPDDPDPFSVTVKNPKTGKVRRISISTQSNTDLDLNK